MYDTAQNTILCASIFNISTKISMSTCQNEYSENQDAKLGYLFNYVYFGNDKYINRLSVDFFSFW